MKNDSQSGVSSLNAPRMRGASALPLLLHAGRLGVALDDDEPLQIGPVLAGHSLPGRLALVIAEGDAPIRTRLGQEKPPPILIDGDMVEVGPPLPADVDRRTEVDVTGGQ